MKIKTNIRAGKKSGTMVSTDSSSSSSSSDVVYTPPVSRCVGV